MKITLFRFQRYYFFTALFFILILFALKLGKSGDSVAFTNKTFLVIISCLFISVYSLCLFPVFHYLNKYINWVKYPVVRFITQVLVLYLLFYILLIASTPARVHLIPVAVGNFSGSDYFLKFKILTVIILIAFSFIDFILFTYRIYLKNKINRESAIADQNKLRFDVLNMQLSPHFLFNNLNTLSSLIQSNTKNAEQYIRNFTGIYKYIIENAQKPVVNLNAELDLMYKYIQLLQVRYPDSVFVKVDSSADFKDFYLPPVTLQILLENALKHNSFSAQNPLLIQLQIFSDKLIVKNKISEKLSEIESFNIGLENIRKRYGNLSQTPVSTAKTDLFTVILPKINAIQEL